MGLAGPSTTLRFAAHPSHRTFAHPSRWEADNAPFTRKIETGLAHSWNFPLRGVGPRDDHAPDTVTATSVRRFNGNSDAEIDPLALLVEEDRDETEWSRPYGQHGFTGGI